MDMSRIDGLSIGDVELLAGAIEQVSQVTQFEEVIAFDIDSVESLGSAIDIEILDADLIVRVSRLAVNVQGVGLAAARLVNIDFNFIQAFSQSHASAGSAASDGLGISRAFVNSDGVVVINCGGGDIESGDRIRHIGNIIIGAAGKDWGEIEAAGIGGEGQIAQQTGSTNIDGDIISSSSITIFSNNNYLEFVFPRFEIRESDIPAINFYIIAQDNSITITSSLFQADFISFCRDAYDIIINAG